MKTETLKKTVVLTQAQFNSRQAAGTLEVGVEYKIIGTPISDVIVRDQTPYSIVNENGIATIPVITGADFGVAKVNPSGGVNQAGGKLYLEKATNAEIEAKTVNAKPIVPLNLDKAVMEGLGNNSLTWTDAYKESARATIDAAAIRYAYVLEEGD